MKQQEHLKNSHGFTLAEVLVSLAIVSIVMFAITSMMTSAQKMKKRLEARLEVAILESASQVLFASREDCDCQLKGLTFNETSPNVEIDLPSLKMACGTTSTDFIKASSNTASTAEHSVKRIFIKDITPTGNSNEYSASLHLEASALADGVPIRTVPLRFRFNTVASSPQNAKVINACGAAELSIPHNLTAIVANGECAISWGASAGAGPITYSIKKSTVSGKAAEGTKACTDTANTTCLAKDLTNGETYYFSIQSRNPYSKSAWSSEVACKPYETPTEPRLTVVAEESACRISVERPAKGTQPYEYTVYQSTTLPVTKSSTTVCSKLSPTGTQTPCQVTGLTNGQKYYFAAIAANDGESNLSLPVECEPIAPCSGSATVTLLDPGGCRLGRRAGDYNNLVLSSLQSRAGGSTYVVKGTINVRGQQPCATVYCPIQLTCNRGTLVPSSVNLNCSRTPIAGTEVDSLPSKTSGIGADMFGWTNMTLQK